MFHDLIDSLGRKQSTKFINEGNLYRLIVHSKLPSAEKFEKWVFDDVLPSIRKHGAYIEPKTLEQMILTPDFGIRLLNEIKSEREKSQALEEEVDRYKRFLCNELETLTKLELAEKLDTSPQTLAAVLRKHKIYTPKSGKVSVWFLEKYPHIKIIKEAIYTYQHPYTKEIIENHSWVWTAEGAKEVVDYLIEQGEVRYCENQGFKMVRDLRKGA